MDAESGGSIRSFKSSLDDIHIQDLGHSSVGHSIYSSTKYKLQNVSKQDNQRLEK